jgi:lysozyme
VAEHVSKRGTRFVARHEGFISCPYWDRWGEVWTIGYGETQGINGGTKCWTKAHARRDLWHRLNSSYNPAHLLGHLKLCQREVDALASLAYNEGPGILTDPSFSTLARRLHSSEAHTYKGRKGIYRDEIKKWTSAGGQVLPGLVTRRRDETRLACKGRYR